MKTEKSTKSPLKTEEIQTRQDTPKSKGMSREKVAILLTTEPNINEFAFKYFVLSLNVIQSTYEFIFPDTKIRIDSEATYSIDSLFNQFEEVKNDIKSELQPSYFINIIQSNIEGNLFFICRSNAAFVTTDVWQKLFSPPSVFEYLLHCIGAVLLFMHPKLDLYSHMETRGCTLDYTRIKMDDKVDISLGYLCDNCREAISRVAGQGFLSDISTIISRNWIGDINSFDSVAYNLKHFFKFDINKDSGFNKTFWDKAKEHFVEIPKELLIALISAVIGAGVALLIANVSD